MPYMYNVDSFTSITSFSSSVNKYYQSTPFFYLSTCVQPRDTKHCTYHRWLAIGMKLSKDRSHEVPGSLMLYDNGSL